MADLETKKKLRDALKGIEKAKKSISEEEESNLEATKLAVSTQTLAEMEDMKIEMSTLKDTIVESNKNTVEAIKDINVDVFPEAPVVPEANVNVTMPEMPKIEVPEPKVTVNVPDVIVPPINVPEPKVTVNVEKPDAPIVNVPDFPEQMSVDVMNDRGNPIPMTPVDLDGKPMDFGGTATGGARIVKSSLLNIDGEKINPATEEKQDTLIANTAQGTTSTDNTTTTPLASGATYIGTGEQNDLPQVGVYCFSDTAGTLFFDWSVDGTNWHRFPTAGFTVEANIPEFHTAVKLGRYFRVEFLNSASVQSTFRLTTYFGSNFLPSNSPINSAFKSDADATLVRTSSDYLLDVARNFVGGHKGIHKFGNNPAIGASSTEDIIFQGTIEWLQAATTVRIKSGGNTNDTAAGSGAQQVIIEGLDEDWNEASETLATNGSSASSATTTTFIRINRAYVGNVGTYSGSNTGSIVIENSAGGTDLMTIEADRGQTQSSAYTIPAGKTGYLTRLQVDSATAKASDVRFFQRRNADDVTTPFTGKRLIQAMVGITGTSVIKFDAYPSYPARTDIWATGTTASGGAGQVGVDYDLILVDD